MNIYFACSITGGREFEPVFQAIVRAMLAGGHHVPTAHLADPSVRDLESTVGAADVYERDIAWIRAADVLVAEVSTPSHGVGYEISFALGLGKPVLACHQQDQRISKMLLGNPDANLVVKSYSSIEDALLIVDGYLSKQILI
jgi:nucleoside 2-deoxyribosyltransferase